MEKHVYNLSLKWENDRKGIMSSPELPTIIEVATPPEFDKGMSNIWSPEHLFTGSVLSCFMTTFLAIAEFSKFEFINFKCDAQGVLEKIEGKYLMTKIILSAELTIDDLEKTEKAQRILEKSEAACLISNSIKSEVELKTVINIEN
ncbi:OsmC family protein [Flavobacterium jejuense]|uniref:OsmC family protein n=1 Tax=Flavobacterium jejuense TaxID=1544455 RepID=A0ABX0ILJ3_9FLAO|nr:OsmC family protein [Flavobacterium jejuense]NHN24106.1 OsmC family protein [Flavobacterium jejuense]